jgi:hypothetical protein
MNSKTDCFDHITRTLMRTGDWRRIQAARFPADMRNPRAANELLRLATSASELTDSQWQRISPFYDPKNDGWRETVSACARDVAFRTKPDTFDAFIDAITAKLAVPA